MYITSHELCACFIVFEDRPMLPTSICLRLTSLSLGQAYMVGTVALKLHISTKSWWHNYNKKKQNKTVHIFHGIYYSWDPEPGYIPHSISNENVTIFTKFSSLAALEVVIFTTSNAASDGNFIKMKIFLFQCRGKASIGMIQSLYGIIWTEYMQP